MKKKTINVPAGIRYLSEWTDFENSIPAGHVIVNKGQTGVGGTYNFLTNSKKVILASPRISLIENKRAKHPDAWVYRDLSDSVASDGKGNPIKKTTTFQDIQKYNTEVVQYIHKCIVEKRTSPKVMTTYDSIGHVVDALNSMSKTEIDSWTLVVDEFQAIFGDACFKSLTEMKLLKNTAKFKNVIYLSATPFLEKYMDQIDEFKNLPYIELVWPNNMKINASVTNVSIAKSRNQVCGDIIRNMKSGKRVKYGNKEIDTSEAVFYINLVSDILRIIKQCGLKQDEVNILCSQSNEKKVKDAGFEIGTIPEEGEPHKMFTFCTRSYFLGCDFFSTCAYSYVFADPTNKTLALDISTDLGQILGRQRLESNPYRNEAIMFYRQGSSGMTSKELGKYVGCKISKTNRQMGTFSKLSVDEQKDLISMIRSHIEMKNYSEDYLCIPDDKKLAVGFNKLFMLAEIRAWQISSNNYNSQYSLIMSQQAAGINGSSGTNSQNQDVLDFKASFDSTTHTNKRIELYSEFRQLHPDLVSELDFMPKKYGEYWDKLGYEGLKKVGFQESKIKSITPAPSPFEEEWVKELRLLVQVRKEYKAAELKAIVGKAYKASGIKRTPKPADAEKVLTTHKVQKHGNGKRTYIIDSIYQKKFSFFPDLRRPNSSKEMLIDRFLDIIKTGNYNISRGNQKRKLSDVITEIRGKSDPGEVSKMKREWLPVASINGLFETRHEHGITLYSSFIALDYDHFKDKTAMDAAKEKLKQHDFVYAIFETPSGNGLKALILHDSVKHELHYNLFSQLLRQCSLPEIDKSVSDISRGQFFSYDPDIWINPSPKAYHFKFDTTIAPTVTNNQVEVVGEKGDVTIDSDTVGLLHSFWEMVLTDDAVIERLDKHWKENHPEYYQVGQRHRAILIMSGTLCKAGILKEKTLPYLCSSFQNIPKSEIDGIVEYCYEHNPFGSDRIRYRRW